MQGDRGNREHLLPLEEGIWRHGGGSGKEIKGTLERENARLKRAVADEMAGDSRDPSINADGMRIVFDSTANINGGNPEGSFDIYLATCLELATARNVPTLSEWRLIAMAGVLGIIGLLAIRRRKVTA